MYIITCCLDLDNLHYIWFRFEYIFLIYFFIQKTETCHPRDYIKKIKTYILQLKQLVAFDIRRMLWKF